MRIWILLNAALLCVSVPLSASDKDEAWIKQSAYGMDCAPCAYAVERSLGRLPGVSTVEVNLELGIAAIGLTRGAEPDLAEIRKIIRRNGFTPRAAELRLSGTLIQENGVHLLEVGVSRFTLTVTDAVPKAELERLSGADVTVTGKVPEDDAARILLDNIVSARQAVNEAGFTLHRFESLPPETAE